MPYTVCPAAAAWDRQISTLPQAHVLQSWAWGDFKSQYGWSAQRLLWTASGQPVAAAQVLTRRLGAGLPWQPGVMYVPKGPLLDWSCTALRNGVLDDLQALARRQHAIFIKLDPDVAVPDPPFPPGGAPTPSADLIAALRERQWRYSADQIQFRNTVRLDLCRSEAELLASMKQKTRYNLRLAEKKGVRIRLGGTPDLELLYRMYAETSLRDGFAIRSPEYYQTAWGNFMAAGLAQPLLAEVEGQPVSAIILFRYAQTAWYMYGMSREVHREKMPNHLLQWEGIRWAKAQGCTTYDFWGAPDEFVESDPMWGVWKFKEGFGGQVERHVGAWDYAPSPWVYRIYTVVIPKILDVMRRRGKKMTQESV